MSNVKIGDLVEDCSLMPGVVMSIDKDDIQTRRLDFNNEQYNNDVWKGFSQCSLSNCGIVKITAEQVKQRLVLGQKKLEKLYLKSKSWDEYQNLIEKEILL